MLDHASHGRWAPLREDQVRMPVLELMTVRDARVARSEVFLFDAAALA